MRGLNGPFREQCNCWANLYFSGVLAQALGSRGLSEIWARYPGDLGFAGTWACVLPPALRSHGLAGPLALVLSGLSVAGAPTWIIEILGLARTSDQSPTPAVGGSLTGSPALAMGSLDLSKPLPWALSGLGLVRLLS